jgi:peroxiredoxin
MQRTAPTFQCRRTSLLRWGALGAGALVGAACTSPAQRARQSGSGSAALPPAAKAPLPPPARPEALSSLPLAPDFTLRGIGSPSQRLAEQRGQVVLLNFWASWAAASKLELPRLKRLHGTYSSQGLVFWGVNLDTDPTVAQAYAQHLGLAYPQLHDTEKSVARQYALNSLPATVLVDRDGRLRYAFLGWREGQDALYEQHIRELVQE